MKIHVIIVPDDESNNVLHAETVVDPREIQNELATKKIGEGIGFQIGGYLEAKRQWDSISEIERMFLKLHDVSVGYKGSAPAGDAEKAWGFTKIKNNCGRIVIPVGDPWREYEYSIDWDGRLLEGVTPNWRTTGRWFRVLARNAEEADMRAKMAVSEKRAAEFERRENRRVK